MARRCQYLEIPDCRWRVKVENNESGKAGGSTTFQRATSCNPRRHVRRWMATAEAAAQEGAAVVVASSRQASVDRAIARLPKSAEGHLVDLSSEQPIRDFFGRIGAFDHLVFTAGEALRLGPLESTDTDAARKFFNLCYWGALMAVKYGSPHIRRGGSITLTTGTAGRRPEKGWTVAASITGAMESLTRALAVELAPISRERGVSGDRPEPNCGRGYRRQSVKRCLRKPGSRFW